MPPVSLPLYMNRAMLTTKKKAAYHQLKYTRICSGSDDSCSNRDDSTRCQGQGV